MHRIIGIFLVGLISVSPGIAQGVPDLVAMQDRSTRIVISYEPKVWFEDFNKSIGEKYTRVRFLGEIHEDPNPGKLILPYRAQTVYLPSSKFHLEILETEFTDSLGVNLLHYPKLERDQEFGLVHEYGSKNVTLDDSNFRIPTEVVDVAQSGDSFVGTVKIYPVQYSSRDGILRVYKKIVISIDSEEARQASKEIVLQDSPLKLGDWYRVDVKETGIYRIDRQFLLNANIPQNSISNINSVRIYGNGGEMIPENSTTPKPEGLQEISRLVVDRNGNGQFDAEDFILFYGKSTRDWTYDKSQKISSHYINHYTETNHYFLTFGGSPGKKVDTLLSQIVPNAFRPSDFSSRVFVEEERFKLFKSGRQWFGQVFDPEASSAVYATSLPGVDASKPVTYRFVILARSNVDESFRIDENNVFLGRIPTYGVDVASIETEYAYRSPVHTFVRTGPLPDNRSVLRFTYELKSSVSKGWLDWFEIHYRRKFVAVNDVLMFTSPDTTATVEYQLSGFSTRDLYVFDVSRHSDIIQVTNLSHDQSEMGRLSFQLAQSSGSIRDLIAVGPNGFKVPSNAQRIDNSNLWGISPGAEFIIITPKEFVSEAQRLKSHREQRDSLSTLVVRVDQIFNEFSGGLPDPLAIRDFLARGYATWQTKPKYVLLLGDGHYDYRNISTSARNWVPPYQTMESVHQILSYASDDHFVLLDPNNPRVSLAIGRLPAGSVKDAATVVDKIIRYETTSPLDPWRNRVTFVADDGLTSTGDEGNIHTYQADLLAQSFTPSSVEKRKVYIIEYPTVSSAAGRRKPDANSAIIDLINRGTMIINYTGHGNPQLWAHEAIFTREGSLPQLSNRDKLTFLVAATCDFARYDNPSEQSAGEEILVMNKGGAIGVVTASRAVYSFENSQFNNSFYAELFQRDADGRVPRLGDVMLRTKQIHYSVNDLKHHLLGDPTLRLVAPRILASIDSINNKPLGDVTNVSTLSKVHISGEARKVRGGRWDDFSGRAILEVFDSKRKISIPEWWNYTYEVQGPLLYRGEVSIGNGKFQAVVPIPKDVSYNNDRSRISIYGWNAQTDIVGFTENIIITGTDTSAAVDTTGPKIDIFLNDDSFRAGGMIKPDATLIVRLRDANGINTSTAGIGHRLEARLKNPPKRFDLTDFYRSDLNTFESGAVQYPLQALPEGRHTLSVKAWDTYNNSSEEETFFEVRSGTALELHHVMNVPNPFNRTTVFTFQRTSTDPVDVEVKVYTLAGRLIESIQRYGVLDRFVQVPWDGRDRDGNEVANGVYFYKVIARSLETGEAREVVGKLTVLR